MFHYFEMIENFIYLISIFLSILRQLLDHQLVVA